MAEKFLRILRTRRTKIGIFRYGTIRMVNISDPRVKEIVDGLTDKGTKKHPIEPAAEVISKKEAEAAREAVESLMPEKEAVSAADDALRAKASVEDELAQTKKALVQAKAGQKKAEGDRAEFERVLAEERAKNEELKAQADAAEARATDAETQLAELAAEGDGDDKK